MDHIWIQGLRDAGLYDDVWQAGAILLPVQSVGVMGDERTYENAVALRAVSSTDGMTADWCHLPYDFLAKVSNDLPGAISVAGNPKLQSLAGLSAIRKITGKNKNGNAIEIIKNPLLKDLTGLSLTGNVAGAIEFGL